MKEKIKTADFHRLKDMCLKAARRKYGYRLPVAIRRRLTGEFREICQLDAAAFYLTAADLAGTLREKGIMFYIDSPATSTLTAYLTGLTEIDPLPPHYSCPVCGRTSFISEEKDGRLLYPSMGETEPRTGEADLTFRTDLHMPEKASPKNCTVSGSMCRRTGWEKPRRLSWAYFHENGPTDSLISFPYIPTVSWQLSCRWKRKKNSTVKLSSVPLMTSAAYWQGKLIRSFAGNGQKYTKNCMR